MSERYESGAKPGSETEQAAGPVIALIGAGSMGGAILNGLCSADAGVARQIRVTTKSAASARHLAGSSDLVTVSATEADPEANVKAVRGADIVVLGVKPWLILDTLREIADDLDPNSIVVSVAAGITLASMEAVIPGHSLVRAMPNTPANVGLGVTGLAAGMSAKPSDIETVARVFETVGRVIVVDESQINAVAAVSGSGPAYLFLYVEEMTAAARRLGFDEDQARLLTEQTVIGAAELLRSSGEDPAELRRRVTSPNGTTERAVAVLQDADLGALFDRALAANVQRSEELAAQSE